MKFLKKVFHSLFNSDLPEPSVTLMETFPGTADSHTEWQHRKNIEKMMIADLRLQWEAQKRTLALVQRTAVISGLSLVVAIFALFAAISKN